MSKLDELLLQINREHVYIQTHNFPDPDAIASAYGMQRLLGERGIRSTICYKGKIDRYSTGKLLDLIGIELLEVEDLKEILTGEDEVILVDSQKGNSNIVDIPGDEIICVDHHPQNDKFQYRFTDIRPDVGACSSIISQYFFENDIAMDWKIATALTYGIRIDTGNLSRGVSHLDMEMLYRMFDLCNRDLIRMLEHSNLCFEDLIAYSRAISSIEVYGNVSFADTGYDCPEALIANVSDFMLALMEVSFSVVYSRKEHGIKLSVRSEGIALDAGRITAEALEGLGNGGGHAAMAGGFVPFSGNERQEAILMDEIKERFVTVLSDLEGEQLSDLIAEPAENGKALDNVSS
jgi:nanoRNase/pAp phosphatase (c-di-AMP/oligoRNAs hydrolase)